MVEAAESAAVAAGRVIAADAGIAVAEVVAGGAQEVEADRNQPEIRQFPHSSPHQAASQLYPPQVKEVREAAKSGKEKANGMIRFQQ